MPKVKIERLNHTYQIVISSILAREIKDNNLKFVTITGVEITNDLSFAKIYYTTLNELNKDEVATSLEKASPFIRKMLAEKVNLRHTPELRFIYDTSIEYGERIEKVIKEIKEEK